MKHIGKSRTQLFEELDKPELRTLPANRYIYEQFKIARVNMDYHITLEKCNYSVPFKYLKDQVEVRYSTQHVRIYFKNEIIATHPRLRTPGETSTLHEHMPNDYQYIHERMNPERLRSWVKSILSILDKKLYLQKSVNNESYKVPTFFNEHANLRDPNTYK